MSNGTEKPKPTPRRPGVKTERYQVLLEPEHAKWAMSMPGGLSAVLRALLKDAFLIRPRGDASGVDVSNGSLPQYAHELNGTERFFLEALRELPIDAITPLVQVMGAFADEARMARRWRQDYIDRQGLLTASGDLEASNQGE